MKSKLKLYVAVFAVVGAAGVGTAIAQDSQSQIPTSGEKVAGAPFEVKRDWGTFKLADRIAEALYARISMGEIDRLDAVFSQWQPGHGIHVECNRLFPFDMSAFPRSTDANAPLLNLACETLLSELTADYMHAQLCNAALHAFAAENEARMEAMAAAHKQIERQLSSLQATQRLVRQEEITAEIIELAAGETASRSD